MARCLPVRLRLSWKLRLIAFFTLTSVAIWLVFFLVLRLFLDEHVARQRFLRDTVAWTPLPQRQERFESVMAEVIARERMVNGAVEELHRRVRRFGEAAATQTASFAGLGAPPRDGSGWGTLMNQFLFAAPQTGKIPGEIDVRETKPALFDPIRSLPLDANDTQHASSVDNRAVTLRERMAQLIHASSVPIDCEMFSAHESLSSACLKWRRGYGLNLAPMSLLLHADFAANLTTDQEKEAASDSAGADEPCFPQFFLPAASSPVRSCFCVGLASERLRDGHGCRQSKATSDVWDPHSRSRATRVAESVNPPLSSREWSFQLGDLSSIDPDQADRGKARLTWLTAGDLFNPVPFSEHPTEQLLRRMRHSRFVGGPSEVTASILRLARYMQMDSPGEMYLLRLALIAYLVPIRENSIFEILVATDDDVTDGVLEGSWSQLLRELEEDESSDRPEARVDIHGTVWERESILVRLIQGCWRTGAQRDSSAPEWHPQEECTAQEGIVLSRSSLNDAMSVALLRAFAPERPPQSFPSASPPVRASQSGCTVELQRWWSLLGLDVLHARRYRPTETPRDDDHKPQCDPSFVLQWLVRTVYQY